MRLDYTPVRGQKAYCDLIRRVSGADHASHATPDYVEATVYNRQEAVVMTGVFSDVPPGEEHKVSHYSYA